MYFFSSFRFLFVFIIPAFGPRIILHQRSQVSPHASQPYFPGSQFTGTVKNMQANEVATIVIDNGKDTIFLCKERSLTIHVLSLKKGSHTCRAGWSSDTLPRRAFPNHFLVSFSYPGVKCSFLLSLVACVQQRTQQVNLFKLAMSSYWTLHEKSTCAPLLMETL